MEDDSVDLADDKQKGDLADDEQKGVDLDDKQKGIDLAEDKEQEREKKETGETQELTAGMPKDTPTGLPGKEEKEKPHLDNGEKDSSCEVKGGMEKDSSCEAKGETEEDEEESK